MNPINTGAVHIGISGKLSDEKWESLFINEIRVCCNIQTQPETIVDYISTNGVERLLNNSSEMNDLNVIDFTVNLPRRFISKELTSKASAYMVCLVNGRIASGRSSNKTWEDSPDFQFAFDNSHHSTGTIVTNLMNIITEHNKGMYLNISVRRPVFLYISEENLYEVEFDFNLHPAYIARSIVFYRRKCDGYRNEQKAIIAKYKSVDDKNSNNVTVDRFESSDEKVFSAISSGKDKFIIQRLIIDAVSNNLFSDYHPLEDDLRICFDRVGYVEITILSLKYRIQTMNKSVAYVKEEILKIMNILKDIDSSAEGVKQQILKFKGI